jgi:thymidylate synthase ThyX
MTTDEQNPILSLSHAERSLPGGGLVLLLNTGATITPEAEAMLQALHSRSVGGIKSHLAKLAAKGPEGFMASYYVGYGHKSIGDCGTVTLFVEGVSMLVAKALQDWMLYSGQEASTRYIDFASQRFVDPVGTPESESVLEAWRAFYLAAQEPVRQHLKEQFPRGEGEEEKIYDKAINARSFDILRGFLPAGATTNLAWHTNLRQAADKLALLRHHPLKEVRGVADALEETLKEGYPSSFGHKRYEATEAYHESWMTKGYHFHGAEGLGAREVRVVRDGIDRAQLQSEYAETLRTRPAKTELPKQLAESGTMQVEFLIDFGSFRDIQRHRAVIQRMPLLSAGFRLHPWYLENLPKAVAEEATALVERQLRSVATLTNDEFTAQYYLPMGLCVPCRVTGDLPALVYLVERRAQTDVHPTLQEVALLMADELLERFGSLGLTLGVDRDQGRFSLKRGTQDIVEK